MQSRDSQWERREAPYLYLISLPQSAGGEAFLLSHFRSSFVAEISQLKDRADLHFHSAVEWSALEPLDGLLQGTHLPDPELADQLLGFGYERAGPAERWPQSATF